MAKDPAFLFYPGDYLRDTQCLSEKVQVAYDRIMCEHMRHICITQQQLNFFTKKLSPDEIFELMSVITKSKAGFQIEWVAESISKRKAYSQSRAENRKGKTAKDMNNISDTYDSHMENGNEIADTIDNSNTNGSRAYVLEMQQVYKQCRPDSSTDENDHKPLRIIYDFLFKKAKDHDENADIDDVTTLFEITLNKINELKELEWYRTKELGIISGKIKTIYDTIKNYGATKHKQAAGFAEAFANNQRSKNL